MPLLLVGLTSVLLLSGCGDDVLQQQVTATVQPEYPSCDTFVTAGAIMKAIIEFGGDLVIKGCVAGQEFMDWAVYVSGISQGPELSLELTGVGYVGDHGLFDVTIYNQSKVSDITALLFQLGSQIPCSAELVEQLGHSATKIMTEFICQQPPTPGELIGLKP